MGWQASNRHKEKELEGWGQITLKTLFYKYFFQHLRVWYESMIKGNSLIYFFSWEYDWISISLYTLLFPFMHFYADICIEIIISKGTWHFLSLNIVYGYETQYLDGKVTS